MGNTILGQPKGTNEILAASDRESVAYAGKRSFLEALVEVLTDLAPSKFTINRLRDRLDDYNKMERGNRRIACPFHRRYPSLDHPSIKLQPMPKPDDVFNRATDSTETVPAPSFYVKVSLNSPENASMTEWISCFASANYPSDVKLHFYTEEALQAGLGANSEKQPRDSSIR